MWRLPRHPELEVWLAEQLRRVNASLTQAVLCRMAQMRLRGSEPHARLFLQATGHLRPAGGDEPASRAGTAPQVVFLAVPRPSDVQVAQSPLPASRTGRS